MESIVDNDVLIKGASYQLLDELFANVARPIGMLGAARFVVPKRIEARKLNAGAASAVEHFRSFAAGVTILEPTDTEQRLAAEFERAAQDENLALDSGESQLCAILIMRAVKRLLTGDKRAIQAAERMLDSACDLSDLCGRLKCLEQLFLESLSESIFEKMRLAVCNEPQTDTAIRLCFSCGSAETSMTSVVAGLESYVNALRIEAPRVLAK